MANYISYYHLSLNYQAFLSSFSEEIEPKCYEDAVKDPRWVVAMQQEIKAPDENGTWQIVKLPEKKSPIDCKWVFKIKYKADGQVQG